LTGSIPNLNFENTTIQFNSAHFEINSTSSPQQQQQQQQQTQPDETLVLEIVTIVAASHMYFQ
jgi:surfactin synthase thioesterase subunit